MNRDWKRSCRGTEYSIYFLLHGVIQHDLYHAGQIALLKKARSLDMPQSRNLYSCSVDD